MKNRKLRCVLAALGAAVMMAACDGAAEPAPGAPEAVSATEAATEVTRAPWRPGDTVWIVYREPGWRTEWYEAIVIEEKDGIVRSVPSGCDEADLVSPFEWQTPLVDCYHTRAEAQAVADAENESRDDCCG